MITKWKNLVCWVDKIYKKIQKKKRKGFGCKSDIFIIFLRKQ